MAKVYLETTIISACVATRTTLRAQYERESTLQWLDREGPKHKLYASDAVIAELSAPTYPNSAKALAVAAMYVILTITPAMEEFAAVLARRQVIPKDLKGDALHVAAATVAKMNFLLTWNVAHLANKNKQSHLRLVCTNTDTSRRQYADLTIFRRSKSHDTIVRNPLPQTRPLRG